MLPLLVLNGVLVLALALVTVGAPADAQPDRRRAGEYVFLTVELQQEAEEGLIVLDTVNRELSVVRWDQGLGTLVPVGARSLARDAEQRAPRRTNR
ncbi:MAG: hypothetical protein AAGI30_05045 [Planctomycetota bacterium]